MAAATAAAASEHHAQNHPQPSTAGIGAATELLGQPHRQPESLSVVVRERSLAAGPRQSEDVGITVLAPPGAGGPTAATEVNQDDRTRARLVYVNAFYLRLADMALTIGLLVWQQLGFAPTWHEACDYDIKIWATVWLGSALARSTLITCIHGANLCLRRPVSRVWSYIQALLEIFAFAWFLYGIHPLFANNQGWCNKTSQVWALLGWTLQALTFFCPCILFITCVPCLLCLTRFEWVRRRILPLLVGPVEPSTNQMPTPESVLTRLTATTFGEAVSKGDIDLEQPPEGAATQPSPGVGDDQSNITKNLFSSTLGVGGFGQAMSTLMQRLNSTRDERASSGVDGGPSQETLRPAAGLEGAPSATAIPIQAGTLTCPICVTEFQPDDQILQLPCEPRKHVFHVSCVQEWLSKSQHCPMCRTNLVEWYKMHDEMAARAAAAGLDVPGGTQPNSADINAAATPVPSSTSRTHNPQPDRSAIPSRNSAR